MNMLDMLCGHLHQLLTMAQDGAQCTHLILRPERRAQQSDRVQELDPLTLVPVGSASRNIFHMSGIDHPGLQSAPLENFEQGNPINACRLHGRGSDTTTLQPVSGLFEIFGEGAEAADRLVFGIVMHGDENLARANVYPCCAGLFHGPVSETQPLVSLSGHFYLSVQSSQAAKYGTLLMGIEPERELRS